MEKNTKKKAFFAIELTVLSLFLLMFVGCLVAEICAPESKIALWVMANIWDVNKTLASLKAHVPVIINCLIYIVLVYSACKLVRMIFKAKMQKSNRTKTVFSLFDGFVKYSCAIAIIILVLKACGVDTTALVASVGVLTLVVGLGAQPLIGDIIAGIFIIFEDEYHVGEIVTINDFRGTVMEIGIRSTKLIDAAGNIKIINNSAIGDVINLSRELSLAVVDCDFPYDVPVELIEKLLAQGKRVEIETNGTELGMATVAATGENGVTLKLGADNAKGYALYRSTDGKNFAYYADVTENTYTDRYTVEGETYYYRAYSYREEEVGVPSEIVSAVASASDYVELKMTLGKTDYTANGKTKTMDVAPIIRNDRTMLPVRYVAEALGAEIAWDGTTSTATITK